MAQAAAATPAPPPVGTPVVAKFAFKAQHKDQLSFEKGATLLAVPGLKPPLPGIYGSPLLLTGVVVGGPGPPPRC